MVRYADLMNSPQFMRFFVLMRDLAPYVLLIVDPQNSSHGRDRCPEIGRRNIELVSVWLRRRGAALSPVKVYVSSIRQQPPMLIVLPS
jgi:hypothetical protein